MPQVNYWLITFMIVNYKSLAAAFFFTYTMCMKARDSNAKHSNRP